MFMSPFRRSGRYERWGCWQAELCITRWPKPDNPAHQLSKRRSRRRLKIASAIGRNKSISSFLQEHSIVIKDVIFVAICDAIGHSPPWPKVGDSLRSKSREFLPIKRNHTPLAAMISAVHLANIATEPLGK